jgi:hypothetical protein
LIQQPIIISTLQAFSSLIHSVASKSNVSKYFIELQDRKSQIRLAEGISNEFSIHTGIPRGSSLSPILYLFYNADLLEIGHKNNLLRGYINDTVMLVTGKSIESIIAKLAILYKRADL